MKRAFALALALIIGAFSLCACEKHYIRLTPEQIGIDGRQPDYFCLYRVKTEDLAYAMFPGEFSYYDLLSNGDCAEGEEFEHGDSMREWELEWEQDEKHFGDIPKFQSFEKSENYLSDEVVNGIIEAYKNTGNVNHGALGFRILEVSVENRQPIFFLEARLNVNLWSPHVLYRYRQETGTLEELYTFDGETVREIIIC